MHIHVDGDRLAHILHVGLAGQEVIQKFLFAGGVGYRDAGQVRDLTQHLVAVPQVIRPGHGGQVRVIDHAGDLKTGVGLHPRLETENLLHRTSQRTADVDHIQNLQRTGLEIYKILMIAAQGCCAHVVAAHIKDDGVPIQNESRRHLGRQGKGLDAGAGEVRGDKTYLLLLHQLAPLRQAEVGVDHIQVQQLRPLAPGGGLHGEVQRQLALAAAIVADQHFNVLHR